MPKHAIRRFTLVALALALAGADPSDERPQLVVVVNQSNPVASLSLSDLARIYRISRTRWPDGTPIVPYLPAQGSEESRALAVNVFHFHSEVSVARFYLRALFEQRIASPPQRTSSAADALRRVAGEPGGVAIILRDGAPVGAGVRILAVEGL